MLLSYAFKENLENKEWKGEREWKEQKEKETGRRNSEKDGE